MRPVVTDRVAWSVGLSVTLVSPAKTAALIKMPFGLRTRVSPGNHVLDGGPHPSMGRSIFEGKGASHCKVWGHSAVPVRKRLNESRCHLGANSFGTQFAIIGFVGYNFGCMIASDTFFDSRGGFLGSSYPVKTADFEVRWDVAMATTLAFYICGAHWRHLANTTEPSMCISDAALCQITLTTCYYY